MKPSMTKKLATLSERMDELNRLLSSEDATSDMDNYRKISREHSEITPIVEQYRAFTQAEADIEEAQAMLAETDVSIENVGRLIGFPNPSHFATRFTAVAGMPPSEFREWKRKNKTAIHSL